MSRSLGYNNDAIDYEKSVGDDFHTPEAREAYMKEEIATYKEYDRLIKQALDARDVYDRALMECEEFLNSNDASEYISASDLKTLLAIIEG
jgi:hypothetical protein